MRAPDFWWVSTGFEPGNPDQRREAAGFDGKPPGDRSQEAFDQAAAAQQLAAKSAQPKDLLEEREGAGRRFVYIIIYIYIYASTYMAVGQRVSHT